MLALMATTLMTTALAQTPPLWPEGETRRLLVSTHVQSPSVLWLMAVQNEERMGATLGLDMVVRCQLHEARRKFSIIRCDVEDAGVVATPLAQHAGQLGGILGDYETVLESAEVFFNVKHDGRVNRVRIELPGNPNQRERYIQEMSETVVGLAFSALDLPRQEDDRPQWRHGTPLLGLSLFPVSTSSLSLDQHVGDAPGEYWGEGTGALLDMNGRAFEMAARTTHRTDPETGRVLEGRAELRGEARGGTFTLTYGLDAAVQDIANASVAPLTSRDLSVPVPVPAPQPTP